MNFYLFRGEGTYVGNAFDPLLFDFWVFKISGNVECIHVGNRTTRAEHGISILKSDFAKHFVDDYSLHQGEHRGHFVGVQAGIHGLCQPTSSQTVLIKSSIQLVKKSGMGCKKQKTSMKAYLKHVQIYHLYCISLYILIFNFLIFSLFNAILTNFHAVLDDVLAQAKYFFIRCLASKIKVNFLL